MQQTVCVHCIPQHHLLLVRYSPEEVLDPLGNHMGLVLALPRNQKAPEHADWATVADLPQFSIDAELLHYVITHQSTLLAQLSQKNYLSLCVPA